jgi:mRNA interferase HicA
MCDITRCSEANSRSESGKFEKRIRKVGRKRGVPVSFDSSHGKGSYYGDRFTTLKDRKKEIGPGLLKAMLDQLGMTKEDLEA